MGFIIITVSAGLITVAVAGWLEANPIRLKDLRQRLPQITE
jgi:hypothetical protein